MNETHPCEIHSLTGCRGEMKNERYELHIVDQDGKVVIDKTVQSNQNGFIDLWLPRNKTYDVTITNDGVLTVE